MPLPHFPLDKDSCAEHRFLPATSATFQWLTRAFQNPHQHTIQSGWITMDFSGRAATCKQQGSGSCRGTCSHFRELGQACFQHSSGLKGCSSSVKVPTNCGVTREHLHYLHHFKVTTPDNGISPAPNQSSLLLNPIKNTEFLQS